MIELISKVDGVVYKNTFPPAFLFLLNQEQLRNE